MTIIAVNSVNGLGIVMGKWLFSEVGTKLLNIIYTNYMLHVHISLEM